MFGSKLAAVAIAAASVFTSVAAADLDPIVIKVRRHFVTGLVRKLISITNLGLEVLLQN